MAKQHSTLKAALATENSNTPAVGIWLPPDAYAITQGKLMGRHMAGQGFIKGWVERNTITANVLNVIDAGGDERKQNVAMLQQIGWRGPTNFFDTKLAAAWSGLDVIYSPVPPSSKLAWQRARNGMQQYCLTGITHTICSEKVMGQFAEYVTEPFAQWDSLICSSHAVASAVSTIWREKIDYLSTRLIGKLNTPQLPMLPVIPLGVHASSFVFNSDARFIARVSLHIDPDELVVLFVGRLVFHAKANPLPMYLAVAAAARQTHKKAVVLECGWFSNAAVQDAYNQAAKSAGVRVIRSDGREPNAVSQAYAAADVFCSLSDNIQETFGITPVEAMAAGLPVVVSDWDGYKDTVEHGKQGFRIPTMISGASSLTEGIHAYEDDRLNYDHYVGYMHAMIGIDVAKATEALAALFGNETLRRQMGAAGKQRVDALYDWAHIIKQYSALWTEQNAIRLAALGNKTVVSHCNNPQFLNPGHLFAHYATIQLHAQSVIQRQEQQPDYAALRQLMMWSFIKNTWLPDVAIMGQILRVIADSGSSIVAITAAAGLDQDTVMRAVAWLFKIGAVRVDAVSDISLGNINAGGH